jgi:hypothetical protein
MVLFNQNTIIVFSALAAVIFAWGFLRYKDWTRFQPQNWRSSLVFVVVTAIVFSLAYYFADRIGLTILPGLPFFLASFILPFILSDINVQPFLRSILLTAAAVAMTMFLPKEGYENQIFSALSGLCVWKGASNLGREESATLLDFLPPFVWLTGIYWFLSSGAYAQPNLPAGILLATIVTAFFVRWVSSPLLWEDPEYIKRTILSVSGGLTLLVMINKLLVIPHVEKIAGLAGIGFLGCYLLETLSKEKSAINSKPSPLDVLKQLALIGALTLLASRLFGCEGLLVLSACAIVNARSGIAQIAGVFWALRVLQQAYTLNFSSNVTGINIGHEYAGAALYLGFVLAYCAAAILQEREKKLLFTSYKSWLFAFGSLFIAATASYLLHAEPTGSLMVSTVVATVLFSVAGGSLFAADKVRSQTLILFPASMLSFSLLLNQLLEDGNTASVHHRTVVVAVLGFILLAASVASFAVGGGFKRRAVEVARD